MIPTFVVGDRVMDVGNGYRGVVVELISFLQYNPNEVLCFIEWDDPDDNLGLIGSYWLRHESEVGNGTVSVVQ